MSKLSDRMAGARLKIERAKEHVDYLDLHISRFLAGQPYRFPVKNDVESGQQIHYVEFTQDIPHVITLTFGDALNNLRASLDYLAWELVGAKGGTQSPRTKFPIYECWNDAQKAIKHGAVDKVGPEVEKLIRSVQPDQAGYELLAPLCKLNNIDKHRTLLMTFIRVGIVEHGIRFGGVAIPTMKFTGSDARWRELKSGDVFLVLSEIPPADREYQPYIKPAFEISFSEAESGCKPRPVGQFVRDLIDTVAKIAGLFEPHV